MSFSVRLSTDVASVEAGATVSVSVEIANRGDDPDRYEMVVEGLDPEWTAVPVPIFPVDPHDISTQKFLIKPPRTSESLAGTYPFVVSVRSLESGEERSAQGILEIRPFHHVSIDLAPKRGIVTTFRPEFAFEVTVMNLGNSEQRLQLFATDTDDACVFEYEEEKIDVAPGQQRTVLLKCSGVRRSLLSPTRLHGFSVSARSTTTPTVSAHAQGQIEQRALTSPTTLVAFLILMLLFTAWYLAAPKPVSMDSLAVDREQLTLGENVHISWSASNAKKVVIHMNGMKLGDNTPVGSLTYTPDSPGEYRINAYAVSGTKQSFELEQKFTVVEPPSIPEPKILSFDIPIRTVELNQPFVIKYKFNPAVVRAKLSPSNEEVIPAATEMEVTPRREGVITYQLFAFNEKGQMAASKELNVTVMRTSKAKIVSFSVDPMKVPENGGVVTLSWLLGGDVARAELTSNGQTIPISGNEGSRDQYISTMTKFTLIAYDRDGVKTEKTVKIDVEQQDSTQQNPETTGATR